MSIEGYYDECLLEAKREILGKDKEYILGVNAEELVEYYATKYMLPTLDVDFGHAEYETDDVPRTQDIPIRFRFPVRVQPRIAVVFTRQSNPYVVGFTLGLDGDRLIVSARIPTTRTQMWR